MRSLLSFPPYPESLAEEVNCGYKTKREGNMPGEKKTPEQIIGSLRHGVKAACRAYEKSLKEVFLVLVRLDPACKVFHDGVKG